MGSFKEFSFVVPVRAPASQVPDAAGRTTSLLVVMVNLDASASASSIGSDSNPLSTANLTNVAKHAGDHNHSGVIRRHRPLHNAPGSTTTTAPAGIGGTSSVTTTPTTAPITTTSAPPATTTTSAPPATTTSAPPSNPVANGGPIVAGASRSECLEPDTPNGGFTSLASLQSTVSSFNQKRLTPPATCLLVYLNGSPNGARGKIPG